MEQYSRCWRKGLMRMLPCLGQIPATCTQLSATLLFAQAQQPINLDRTLSQIEVNTELDGRGEGGVTDETSPSQNRRFCLSTRRPVQDRADRVVIVADG
jgi:hypothetical protein